jgi:hypothetical protein
MGASAKFKLNLDKDFDYIKNKKAEQAAKDAAAKPAPKPAAAKPVAVVGNMDMHKLNSDKTNIHKVNIHKPEKQEPIRPRTREPQSVAALRDILREKLAGHAEAVVKMAEIAREIGFSTSWMQFAMKRLVESNEFIFTRYAEGKIRGTKVTALKEMK